MTKSDYKNRAKPNVVDNPEKLFPGWYWVTAGAVTVYILFFFYLLGGGK